MFFSIRHYHMAPVLSVALCLHTPEAKAKAKAEAEAEPSGAMVHPGILHSQAEIDFVRGKLAAKAEPWQSAWQALRSHRWASLRWKPEAHRDVLRGPSNRPSVGADELMDDSAAAYTHALCWALTGEKAHAEKVIKILDAYAGTLKTIGHHDARLLVGMAGIRFVNAAELIKHSDAGWEPDGQERFAVLLREVLYPVIKDFYPSANGNWDASMIQTMLAMGVYLDDREMFQRAVHHFRDGEGNGCITRYFKPSGQCQESGRDQRHTQMGIGYLAFASVIAWKQGVDLYGAADNLLAKGYEYTARYNLGDDDVPFERYVSFEGRYKHSKISPKARGRLSPIYEIAYHHYHGRKGLPMPYTLKAVEKKRPERPSGAYTPWCSLMFAGALP